ncbi:helix-turn-helix transcriptional regulator [Oscillibacter valericigenes]|nr:helix-turn-helix transcriptional regulator [Oscillibacter valericigenes]
MYFRRIHDLREDQDIKQKAVAEYLGMDPTVYRRYEKGVRSVPVDVVIKLADYYKVSTDYLLGRTDDPTPPQKSK